MPKTGWRVVDDIDLSRETWIVIGICALFLIFRTVLATLSTMPWMHHGWNEGHYTLIAYNFLENPLTPMRTGSEIYNVTPLYPYLASAGFAIFGDSLFIARFVSILAGIGAILSTYAFGRLAFGKRWGVAAAGLLALLPLFQLHAGRAQTDMTMIFFMTSSLAAIVYGYTGEENPERWLALGGVLFALAFATKQPAMLIPAIVLGWLVSERQWKTIFDRKTGILIGSSVAAFVPLLVWFLLNYLNNPSEFASDWLLELTSRTAAFANVNMTIKWGLIFGMTPIVLGLCAIGFLKISRTTVTDAYDGLNPRSILAWWALLYGLFVLYRTPGNHEYYTVALAPPIALLAVGGAKELRTYLSPERRRLGSLMVVGLLLSGAIFGSAVTLERSGEFSYANGGGSQSIEVTAEFLAANVSENDVVYADSFHLFRWELRNEENADQIHQQPSDLQTAVRTTLVNNSGSVYVVETRSVDREPMLSCKQIYSSQKYRYMVLKLLDDSVGSIGPISFQGMSAPNSIRVYEVTTSNAGSCFE